MYNKPLVSVVIPCYNQFQYLNECLESISNQTYSNIEIVIVDDGSDEKPSNIELINFDNSLIKTLTISNSGLPFARNYGIKNSNGKYILPLDADDKIASNYIEKAVCLMENDAETCLVYGQAMLFGDIETKWNLEKYSLDKMIFYNQIYASALFRRSDYDLTEGYDIQMNKGWEDWDFWLSMLSLKNKVQFIEDICFYYRIRNNSMSRVMSNESQIKLRRYIYQKHSNMYDDLFTDPISLYHEYLYYKNKYNSNIYRQIKAKIKSIISL